MSVMTVILPIVIQIMTLFKNELFSIKFYLKHSSIPASLDNDTVCA